MASEVFPRISLGLRSIVEITVHPLGPWYHCLSAIKYSSSQLYPVHNVALASWLQGIGHCQCCRWTSNSMREIRVLTFEEPIDCTQSTPTKHKSKYDILTQHAHLIASPLDPWEQEACTAMHRSELSHTYYAPPALVSHSWFLTHADVLHVG